MSVNRRTESVSQFILDHARVSYLIWVLLFFFIVSPLSATAPLDEPTRFGWLAWVVVAELVSTPALVFLLKPPPGRNREMLAVRWALAQAPLLFSYVALYDRAPQWLAAIAFGEALILMVYSVRRSRRELAEQNTNGGRGLVQ